MKHPIPSIFRSFILPCIVVSMLLFTAAHVQPIDSVGNSTLSNIEFAVTNNGMIAYNPSARTGKFIAPRGGKSQYLFGGGLWFAAQRMVGDTLQRLVSSTYNPVTKRSAATPGDAFTNDTAAPPIVYHSTKYDRWKYPLFRRLGAFSIDRLNSRDALRSLDYAARLATEKRDRSFLIFPQGKIEPANQKRLQFETGVIRLIDPAGAVQSSQSRPPIYVPKCLQA